MNPENFTLRVFGVPQPKGNKRAFLVNKKQVQRDHTARAKVTVTEGRNKSAQEAYELWTTAVHTAAVLEVERRQWKAYDEPLIFAACFWLPRPKSRKHDYYCDTAPDYDKLVRAVWDELQRAKVLTNDGRFVRFGEPNGTFYATDDRPVGCSILIRPVAWGGDSDE